MRAKIKSLIHRFLHIAIFIKGVDGCIDVLTGAALFIFGQRMMVRIIPFLLRRELLEDPKDLIVNYLFELPLHISHGTQVFLSFYLLIHGVVKIALAIAFNINDYRIHNGAEVVLFISILYQTYRFTHTHSLLLLAVTLMDIIILILVHREGAELKKKGIIFSLNSAPSSQPSHRG